MKKILTIALAALTLASLAACSQSKQESQAETAQAGTTAEATTAAATTAAAEKTAAADVSSWNWIKGELDCYGYGDCYLSYEVPDQFTLTKDDSSGLQYRSYNYDPNNGEATPNESPYGVYITFGQGTFGGATKSSLEESVQNGLTERELGGRTVLFGEYPNDPNTGSHAYVYYTSYSDDEYARIWIILCDPEADGDFRKTFEESMSFTKPES